MFKEVYRVIYEKTCLIKTGFTIMKDGNNTSPNAST